MYNLSSLALPWPRPITTDACERLACRYRARSPASLSHRLAAGTPGLPAHTYRWERERYPRRYSASRRGAGFRVTAKLLWPADGRARVRPVTLLLPRTGKGRAARHGMRRDKSQRSRQSEEFGISLSLSSVRGRNNPEEYCRRNSGTLARELPSLMMRGGEEKNVAALRNAPHAGSIDRSGSHARPCGAVYAIERLISVSVTRLAAPGSTRDAAASTDDPTTAGWIAGRCGADLEP
jgi:hypothetical protein